MVKIGAYGLLDLEWEMAEKWIFVCNCDSLIIVTKRSCLHSLILSAALFNKLKKRFQRFIGDGRMFIYPMFRRC